MQIPPAGSTLALHLVFPAGRPFLLNGKLTYEVTAVVDSDGALDIDRLNDPNILRAVRSKQNSRTGTACSDRSFVRDGAKWVRSRMPIGWRWGRGIPRYLGPKQTRRSLRSAHGSWANLRSNCRHDVRTYVRFRYNGRTRRSTRRDGVNLVDFGRLGSGALGATYTWFQNGRMLESDMRLNSRYRWTNRRRGRGFRVANVAVHELGHQLGLGHVGSGHGSLTMYSVTYPGEIKKVTLGRGDLRGIASLYGRR